MKWKGRRQSTNVEIMYDVDDPIGNIIRTHQKIGMEERKEDPDDFKRIPGIPVPTPNPRRVDVTPGGIKEKKDRLKKQD